MGQRIINSAFFLALLLCLTIDSAAQDLGGDSAHTSADQLIANYARVKNNCYEIVVLKPEQDSMVYDKPLNWDLVNFIVREDKYIPLGTAFAINQTDLVTAAHVMKINDKSQVYRDRFVREKKREGNQVIEKIYSIDKIKAFNNNKDYIVFTLKEKVFTSWFEIENNFPFDCKIYTAGDAYGEGIVIRDGILLDQIPENEYGKWYYLKSSIATNPGSSGGPLLSEQFKAIGIVLAKKDDFCYSLPLSEIVADQAIIHQKNTFGFAPFNEKRLETLDAELQLPVSIDELTDWYYDTFYAFYLKWMNALLEDHRDTIFPNGENSLKALYSARTSSFPQIFLQDSNDKNWFSSRIETSSSDIGDNGRISWGEIYKNAKIWLMNVRHPDSIEPLAIYNDTLTMMDLILKGINITRKLTENDPGSRILSYGEPTETITHTDRWDRTWKISMWLLEYSDKIVLTMSTPTPQGVALLYLSCSSSQRYLYLFDLKKMADFINVSYMGNLTEWRDFLKNQDILYGPLEKLDLTWENDKWIELKTGDFTARFPEGVFPVTDENDLLLLFDIFMKKDNPVWDIRKVFIDDGGEGDNYMIIYRWLKPFDTLPDNYQEEWKTMIVDQEHPYDGIPYSNEGKTGVGILLPDFIEGGKTVINDDYAYTAFISKRGNQASEKMLMYLNDFVDQINLTNHSDSN